MTKGTVQKKKKKKDREKHKRAKMLRMLLDRLA